MRNHSDIRNCSKCRAVKSKEDFGYCGTRDRYDSWCKQCKNRNSMELQKFRRQNGLCYLCGESSPNGYCDKCRVAQMARSRRYATQNKEIMVVRRKAASLKAKIAAFQAYGGPKCACCGEGHLEFLTIDHIAGGGTKHRKMLLPNAKGGGRSGYWFYKWLERNKYPAGYQVLCFNCNCAKGAYGICPHNRR